MRLTSFVFCGALGWTSATAAAGCLWGLTQCLNAFGLDSDTWRDLPSLCVAEVCLGIMRVCS
jgi:hypothetical protein